MTDLNKFLDEREKLSAAATPGFWFWNRELGVYVRRVPDLEPVLITSEVKFDDAAFIADARQSVPKLVSMMRTAISGLQVYQSMGRADLHEAASETIATLERMAGEGSEQ